MNIIDQIKLALNAGLVPFVQGSPGLGKSAIVKQIAKGANLKVIDVRLAQCDITDLNGFPKLDGDKAKYLPMETFPIESDPIPKGYNGVLLFLDELNSASKEIQAAAYKIILDRQVGLHNLHPNCYIVAAGNLATDNAVVSDMSTALRSRLCNLIMNPDSNLWLDWARNNNLDFRITSFVSWKPEKYFFSFNPDIEDKSYCCPRTWEMLDRVLKVNTLPLEEIEPVIQGVIGPNAIDFIAYTSKLAHLPSIDEVLNGTAKVPSDMGDKFMVADWLLTKVNLLDTEDKVKNACDYSVSLGREFSVIFFVNASKKNTNLLQYKCFREHLVDLQMWLNK